MIGEPSLVSEFGLVPTGGNLRVSSSFQFIEKIVFRKFMCPHGVRKVKLVYVAGLNW